MRFQKRSTRRFDANIWPGFVDAMTALLLVLVFMLSIFMVIQFVLRDTITNQENELDKLVSQINLLTSELNLEQSTNARLEQRIANLSSAIDQAEQNSARQSDLIDRLNQTIFEQDQTLSEQTTTITQFEQQVAVLIASRAQERAELTQAQAELNKLNETRNVLERALVQARAELDAELAKVRLDSSKQEALQALIDDLQAQQKEQTETLQQTRNALDDTVQKLSEAEQNRLLEAEAARVLRARLQNADTELTAMTLALEQARRDAEETLILLAAAETAQANAERVRDETLTEIEKRAALLAIAQKELANAKSLSEQERKQIALLNQQLLELRTQINGLQNLLDIAKQKDDNSQIQITDLGNQLNIALARVATEEKRRAELEAAAREKEEAERIRLEQENQDLSQFRSEFFAALRDVLGNQKGVRIVGDRFVFQSEILFDLGQAVLSEKGKKEISQVVSILRDVEQDIPQTIPWIIRVDGHTDDLPLSGFGQYKDNWELSQARALSVVRYMINDLGMTPERVAAAGFGQYQPLNSEKTDEARRQNRRIEMKLTER